MASLMLNYLVTNMVPIIVNAGLGAGRLTIFLAANGYRVLVLALPLAVTTPLFPYLAGLHRAGEVRVGPASDLARLAIFRDDARSGRRRLGHLPLPVPQ